jgi:hypothetical protein
VQPWLERRRRALRIHVQASWGNDFVTCSLEKFIINAGSISFELWKTNEDSKNCIK